MATSTFKSFNLEAFQEAAAASFATAYAAAPAAGFSAEIAAFDASEAFFAAGATLFKDSSAADAKAMGMAAVPW